MAEVLERLLLIRYLAESRQVVPDVMAKIKVSSGKVAKVIDA
jgi:hypothetical protein